MAHRITVNLKVEMDIDEQFTIADAATHIEEMLEKGREYGHVTGVIEYPAHTQVLT